jgi:hypothetical protein
VTNPDLIELAMRMVQTKAPNSRLAADGEPGPPQHEPPEVQTPPPLPTAPANLGLLHTPHVKGTKSAEELAAMILADLREMQGCPKAGVNVTVYGSNPWNSWLSFGGAAGPVNNKAELQELCEIITERLKRLYDVSMPGTGTES